MRIENWTVIGTCNPYQAPEEQKFRVCGEVYGNPSFTDGTTISTSSVVSIKDNTITTQSGNTYELGEPNEDYAYWCWENGHHIPTPEEPIKVS